MTEISTGPLPQLRRVEINGEFLDYRNLPAALTGESAGKFVRSVRLTKAIDLLKDSDLTVSEIAYETGFSEPGYFTKVFSKEYQTTPTEFRAQLHKHH